MKRVMIGGFISLIGTIWSLAFILIAANNLVDSWPTPPGRFLTSMSQLHIMPFFVFSIICTICGIIIMLIEYFKKSE